jgi:hypothetical protein
MIMPRGQVQKHEILAKIYKLKTSLYSGEHEIEDDEWRDGAHYSLNKILDILQEFRE